MIVCWVMTKNINILSCEVITKYVPFSGHTSALGHDKMLDFIVIYSFYVS